MNKKIKVLIFSSLFLNCLLVGVLIGDASHRFHLKHIIKKSLKQYASELPDDKETLFWETVEKVESDNQNKFDQIRQARKEAMTLLSAPEFDEAAYRVQLEKIHQLRNTMKQSLADATIELAKNFNQEERKTMAEYLIRLQKHSRDKKKSHGKRLPHNQIP